jgi:hypothetical protein
LSAGFLVFFSLGHTRQRDGLSFLRLIFSLRLVRFPVFKIPIQVSFEPRAEVDAVNLFAFTFALPAVQPIVAWLRTKLAHTVGVIEWTQLVSFHIPASLSTLHG